MVIECWRQDIYSVFTNLIENSLYWMEEKKSTIYKKSCEQIHKEKNPEKIWPKKLITIDIF